MIKVLTWVFVPVWVSVSYLVLDLLWLTNPGMLAYPLSEIHFSQVIILSAVPLLVQTLLSQLLTLASNSSSSCLPLLKTVNTIKAQTLKLTLVFFGSISSVSELKILSSSQVLICTLCFLLSIAIYTIGALCDHFSNTQFLAFPGLSFNIFNTASVLFLLLREFFYSFKYTN